MSVHDNPHACMSSVHSDINTKAPNTDYTWVWQARLMITLFYCGRQ